MVSDSDNVLLLTPVPIADRAPAAPAASRRNADGETTRVQVATYHLTRPATADEATELCRYLECAPGEPDDNRAPTGDLGATPVSQLQVGEKSGAQILRGVLPRPTLRRIVARREERLGDRAWRQALLVRGAQDLVGAGEKRGELRPRWVEATNETGEQRQRRDKLGVVRRSEELVDADASFDYLVPDSVNDPAVIPAENRVQKECICFGDAGDCVPTRPGTGAESIDLGEDVPHPMRLLAARLDLVERATEVVGMGFDEGPQVDVGHVELVEGQRSLSSVSPSVPSFGAGATA